MTLRDRIKGIFARQTQPSYDNARPGVWLPAKRGNIYITHDKALELSTCYACVRVISEDIAKLPWNVYAREGNKRRLLDSGAVSRLLNTRPNPQMNAFTFRETLMAWALTWGNGYAEIERNIGGQPVALWPLSPDRVDPKIDRETGRVIYEVRNPQGRIDVLEQRDVFHVHGIGFDGLVGYSMVGLAAQTLGFALAAEEHGSSFYGNNTTPGLALKTEATLSEEGFQRLKAQIEDRKGSARAYEGFILEQGLDFARPNMSQVDAQYVETRRQAVEEICRWWRVPPHKVAELSRAHFSNVEHLNIDYATDTLMPWIKRLEEEADFKLIGARSQASYTKIAIQGIMRGDAASRASFYREMFHLGIFSPNEIRALEDMDPIGPEGDEHYIQSQFTTLKKINEEPEPEPMPEEDPEENIARQVDAVANRFLRNDLKDAAKAARRWTQRDQFVEWMANDQRRKSFRRQMDVSALVDLIRAVHGVEIEAEVLLDAYETAARLEMLAQYDGSEADYARACQKVMELIL